MRATRNLKALSPRDAECGAALDNKSACPRRHDQRVSVAGRNLREQTPVSSDSET